MSAVSGPAIGGGGSSSSSSSSSSSAGAKGGARSGTAWIAQRLIGPRPFALDRLVAIYRAICDANGEVSKPMSTASSSSSSSSSNNNTPTSGRASRVRAAPSSGAEAFATAATLAAPSSAVGGGSGAGGGGTGGGVGGNFYAQLSALVSLNLIAHAGAAGDPLAQTRLRCNVTHAVAQQVADACHFDLHLYMHADE